MSACGRAALYFAVLLVAQYTALWSRFSEVAHECDGPILPSNQSGLKVIVAGLAKTGTRSMSRALYQLGLDHSYHSEEFSLFIWSRLSDKFWLRRSGGSWSGVPVPSFVHNMNLRDEEVLNGTSPEELAAAISRCRVDAIAFDGIEKLLLPVHAVSPGAKVILLDWRTFEEWRKSLEDFQPLLFYEIVFCSVFLAAPTFLPWGVLYRVIDPLVGRRIEKMLRSGGPPICQVYDAYVGIFHVGVNTRWIASRWFSGLSFFPQTEEQYATYFQKVKEVVPREQLLRFDMRTHTFEDLCAFLGIRDCRKKGRLPRANNAFCFMQDFPATAVLATPVIIFLHWANWRALNKVLSLCSRPTARRQKAE